MTQVLVQSKRELPAPVARRGITEAQWLTLCNSLFPGAESNSVLMVWDYCIARRLDPLKKPCHIVPMEVKVKTEHGTRYVWRDVVMPGIYEHRTTAQRTGQYLGHSKPEYGEELEIYGVMAPEWCDFTVYRWNSHAGMKAEFPVRVYFAEVVALTKDKETHEFKANSRWAKAPVQMLTKCAEAAALREAFPDELGGQQTAEEMDGQRAADAPIDVKPVTPAPDGYENFISDLEIVATEGLGALEECFAKSAEPLRTYLTKHDAETWASLQSKAITGPPPQDFDE